MTRSNRLYRGAGCVLAVLSTLPLSASSPLKQAGPLSEAGASGADTRLLRAVCHPIICAASIVTAGTPGLKASVRISAGATYDWSGSSNVTAILGDGRNAITFTAGSGRLAILKCIITRGRNSTTATKQIAIVAAPQAAITTNSPVTVGKARLKASVPFQASCTYAWKLEGAKPLSDLRSHDLAFEAGKVGLATLTCTVTNLAGTQAAETKAVSVVAAPVIPFITAPTLVSVGKTATASVPDQAGCSYAWSIPSGSAQISGGNGSPVITFVASDSQPFTLQCTVSNSAGTKATGTANVSVTETQAITGSMLQTYLSFNATAGDLAPIAVPVSLASSAFRAVQADGRELPGTYDVATGAFQVPNIPTGHFWLISNNYNYLWTKHTTVDFGWDQPNRADVDFSAATAVFNITGLKPWQSNDYLVLYEPNNALYSNPESEAMSGTPAEGDLALNGLALNLSQLLDITKGDTPRLLQVASSTLGSENLYVACKEFQPTVLSMQPGGTSILNGQFLDIPQTSTFVLNYKRSQFAAYRGQYPPMARLRAPYLAFYAQPGASVYGNTEESFDLLYCQNGNVAETSDLNLGAVPAPAVPKGYETLITGGDTYSVNYQLPGTVSPWSLKARVRSYTLTPPTATQPLLPLVSPIKNPTINGLSLFGEQTGVGLTPTLTWMAPDLGSPYGYVLQLYRLSAEGESTVGAMMARLFCDGDQTSLTLPAGLLTPGETYALNIRAFAGPRSDLTGSPLRNAKYPYGCAEILSGPFRP